MNTVHLRLLSLLLVLAGAGWAYDAAPAAIQKLTDKGAKSDSGNFPTAFVIGESVDGLEFVVNDPKSPNRLTIKYGSYEVEYGESTDVDYLRGKNLEEAGDWAKALEAYTRGTQNARVQWVKEQSYLRAALAAMQLKRYDDALAAVAGLEKDFPRSVLLDDALLVRGQAQVAKGDAPGAGKTYQTLAGMAKDWGEAAAVFGARGQAAMLAADKKFAEAADALTKLVARLDPAKGGAELAVLRLELADDLRQAGKPDDALPHLQAVAYSSAAGAASQARAHLIWARLLATKPDAASQAAAFDQAALAAAPKGGEAATVAEARKLAQTVTDALLKDASVSAADKAEYKRNLAAF